MALDVIATDVHDIVVWTDLFAGTIGIVLSIVAIVFAVLGSIRLEKVTDATIRSLQKIESDVGRVNEQTSGLLKAGWDRMLASMGGSTAVQPEENEEQLISGLASELRAALDEVKRHRTGDSPAAKDAVQELEEAIEDFRPALVSQRSATRSPRRRPSQIDSKLAALPADARELAYQISPRHLTLPQYKRLSTGPLRESLKLLRRAGILVPLSGHSDDGNEERVYWFPDSDLLSTLLLSRPGDPRLTMSVRTQLQKVGYLAEERAD